ncbi:hypothetical protein [Achromobacter xylosoxidans]|uniref:hypothetical protein n=1 Tax=Alcaligenes xylosoxydans xylosoxydans TaxID=85698 RepID=UPI001177D2F9|nr:hypothetical protein [Achromobacter xylosoxidans]
MTPEEAKALPGLTPEAIAWGGISSVAGIGQERTAAMDKWKAENPERYQAGLRAQELAASGQPQRTQTATDARKGGGGSGGGAGSSSANTLLTGTGNTQGADPSALDLSKNTLLGL